MENLTQEQKTRIQQYLQSKKLPNVLQQEIIEHYISQIQDLRKKENLDFETAFLKTKESWKDDFRLKRSFLTNLRRKPALIVAFEEQKQKKILSLAFGVGLLQILTQLVLAFVWDRESFVFSAAFMYGILNVGLPCLVLVCYLVLKIKDLLNAFQKKSLVSANHISYLLIIAYIFTRFFSLPTNPFKIIYDFLHAGSFDTETFLLANAGILTATTTYVYLLLYLWNKWKASYQTAS